MNQIRNPGRSSSKKIKHLLFLLSISILILIAIGIPNLQISEEIQIQDLVNTEEDTFSLTTYDVALNSVENFKLDFPVDSLEPYVFSLDGTSLSLDSIRTDASVTIEEADRNLFLRGSNGVQLASLTLHAESALSPALVEIESSSELQITSANITGRFLVAVARTIEGEVDLVESHDVLSMFIVNVRGAEVEDLEKEAEASSEGVAEEASSSEAITGSLSSLSSKQIDKNPDTNFNATNSEVSNDDDSPIVSDVFPLLQISNEAKEIKLNSSLLIETSMPENGFQTFLYFLSGERNYEITAGGNLIGEIHLDGDFEVHHRNALGMRSVNSIASKNYKKRENVDDALSFQQVGSSLSVTANTTGLYLVVVASTTRQVLSNGSSVFPVYSVFQVESSIDSSTIPTYEIILGSSQTFNFDFPTENIRSLYFTSPSNQIPYWLDPRRPNPSPVVEGVLSGELGEIYVRRDDAEFVVNGGHPFGELSLISSIGNDESLNLNLLQSSNGSQLMVVPQKTGRYLVALGAMPSLSSLNPHSSLGSSGIKTYFYLNVPMKKAEVSNYTIDLGNTRTLDLNIDGEDLTAHTFSGIYYDPTVNSYLPLTHESLSEDIYPSIYRGGLYFGISLITREIYNESIVVDFNSAGQVNVSARRPGRYLVSIGERVDDSERGNLSSLFFVDVPIPDAEDYVETRWNAPEIRITSDRISPSVTLSKNNHEFRSYTLAPNEDYEFELESSESDYHALILEQDSRSVYYNGFYGVDNYYSNNIPFTRRNGVGPSENYEFRWGVVENIGYLNASSFPHSVRVHRGDDRFAFEISEADALGELRVSGSELGKYFILLHAGEERREGYLSYSHPVSSIIEFNVTTPANDVRLNLEKEYGIYSNLSDLTYDESLDASLFATSDKFLDRGNLTAPSFASPESLSSLLSTDQKLNNPLTGDSSQYPEYIDGKQMPYYLSPLSDSGMRGLRYNGLMRTTSGYSSLPVVDRQRLNIEVYPSSSDSSILKARIPTSATEYLLAKKEIELSPGIWDIDVNFNERDTLRDEVRSSLAQDAPVEIYLDGQKVNFVTQGTEQVDSRLVEGGAPVGKVMMNLEQFSEDTFCDAQSDKIWHAVGRVALTSNKLILPKIAIIDDGQAKKSNAKGTILADSMRIETYKLNPFHAPVFRSDYRSWEDRRSPSSSPLLSVSLEEDLSGLADNKRSKWRSRNREGSNTDNYLLYNLRNSSSTILSYDFNSKYSELFSNEPIEENIVYEHRIYMSFNHGKGVSADSLVKDLPIDVSWPGTNFPSQRFLVDQSNILKSERCHFEQPDVYRRLATVEVPEGSEGNLELRFLINKDINFRRKGRARGYVVTPENVLLSRNTELDTRGYATIVHEASQEFGDSLLKVKATIPNYPNFSDIALTLYDVRDQVLWSIDSLKAIGMRDNVALDDPNMFAQPGFVCMQSSLLNGTALIDYKTDVERYPLVPLFLNLDKSIIPSLPERLPVGNRRLELIIKLADGSSEAFNFDLPFHDGLIGRGDTCGNSFELEHYESEQVDTIQLDPNICGRISWTGQSCTQVCEELGLEPYANWGEKLTENDGALCQAGLHVPKGVPMNFDYNDYWRDTSLWNVYPAFSPICSRRRSVSPGVHPQYGYVINHYTSEAILGTKVETYNPNLSPGGANNVNFCGCDVTKPISRE